MKPITTANASVSTPTLTNTMVEVASDDDDKIGSCHAQKFLHNINKTPTSSSSEDDITSIQEQVFCFLQTKDKYTALGFNLL
jgi:hypothetical protein